ncbi:LA_2272 family surface repeat-containing protein [Sorangium sp. So ce1000]|uniref:LA_2272 family surface repeat-containing protein n=1 Tax=Sorangium sp. So ce1000 TaxID=3133325 RepID=UPI003F60E0DE
MNTPDAAPLPAASRGSPRRDRKTSARSAGFRAGAVLLRALAAAAVFAAISAPPADVLAEEPSTAGVDLVVDGAPWTLDPDAVSAAVGRELGGGVTLAPAAVAGRPTLVLRGEPDGRVTLTYRAPDGRRIERTIDVPEDPDRAAEAIALLAGNLVRDEAAELAAALGKRPPAAPPAAQPAPAPSPPAAVGPTPSSHAARPAKAARSAPALLEPPACALPGARTVLFGADVVPLVGSSTYTGTNVVRRYSLSLVAGYTAGTTGVELSAGASIFSSFLCGAQLSTAANLVFGPARGVQLTGGVNAAGSLRGAQIGAINAVAGPVTGAQVGMLDVAAGPVAGAQVGAANVAVGPSVNLQIGVANVAVSDATDAQIGVANVAVSDATDVQLGLANVAVGGSTGTQISLTNVAASASTDVQIGLLNIATGKVGGVQIGLVNYAGESPFSLGLLNFVRKGRLHLDVWGLESGIAMVGLKHGSDHIHNIYGIGLRLVGDHPLLVSALGLGGRIPISERVYADLDVLGYALHETSTLAPAATVAQARALLGFRLAPELAIFGGPSFNVSFGGTPEDAELSPYGSAPLGRDDAGAQRAWPGVVLGVQAF